ncbi:MAG: AbrB/MazE/SpoVT family DNA-binding domain-containing protein [candidate division NC10 bacterium]|jgi:AbrB family looped-hinge helix DNA binding protein|nr:AbrB/MazE/SpoVT family DNA-binding domain-containing protein [candidate division NC10 bacterium]MBI2114609.1 AbrB/MazE/SpoVT family DNA-binding domain-containing protein [candidate division NC10 bacterium]MBI2164331.1 AbrB/MazE/SpoVT family DNA-binding domain-containing protein [candidate division NC10 bacterium]MBI2456446.1 AbrB/MazE/SpoVT family DNA-binding domain-containing protein [candidate division NC10 bacterium]MBI3085923.1 AbrB/MazE/SpoVT family DNA-binding domain-containing protein
MGSTVKLSAKHQIVIPRDVRRQLGLAAGDGLLVEVRANTIVLVPRPRSYTNRLRGLHKEVWRDVDPATYVREERKGWR